MTATVLLTADSCKLLFSMTDDNNEQDNYHHHHLHHPQGLDLSIRSAPLLNRLILPV
jgi:hypothetical protein